MILSYSTFTFILLDILYVLTLMINLVSLDIIQCKEIVVKSWKRELIILKDSNDLFLTVFGSFSEIL